jgi:outer membrane protein OmpA-like peptidoglycan-associated protein
MSRQTLVAALLGAVMLGVPALADELSTSVMRPTPVDAESGLVAGKLPGGAGARSWYVALDLQPGDLMAQLRVSGTPNSGKRLAFELLNSAARVADSFYVMAGLEANGEATKVFPIDRAGRYVVRLVAEGNEVGTYCVLMGGTALPVAKAPGCPPPPGSTAQSAPPPVTLPEPAPPAKPMVARVPLVAAPPPPASAPPVDVIVSTCEERLRVGSDFLFDFDRAEVRAEAEPALAELSRRIAAADKAVLIEGHTDAIGTDSYNQGLSERRAMAVRMALVDRGLRSAQLKIRGFGKSRPVAPNQQMDGQDDPSGRQKNRRVEVVINTCG